VSKVNYVKVPVSCTDHSGELPQTSFEPLVPEAAACFWAVYARCWADEAGAFSALNQTPPSFLEFFEAASFQTNAKLNQQIRVSKKFYGAFYQDGVLVRVGNRKKTNSRTRRNRGACRVVDGPDRTKVHVAYEPDHYRNFCLVHLLFSFGQRLWLFVEILEGATKRSHQKRAPWQDPIIPNWPHLQTRTQEADNTAACAWINRLDIVCVETVESVVCIVPDPAQPEHEEGKPTMYWCALDEDTVPFDEIFYADSPYKTGPVTSTSFTEAVNLQPSDLVPVSKFQRAERNAQVRRASADRQAHDMNAECEQAAGELSDNDSSGTDINSMSEDDEDGA
jgi:hypothetical protein